MSEDRAVVRTLDTALGRLAIAGIHIYQRHLSPRKGYSCAHRLKYGGDSCSEFARKVFAVEGGRAGLTKLRARFRACHAARQSLGVGQLQHRVYDADLDDPPGSKPGWRADECVKAEAADCCCQGCGEMVLQPVLEGLCSCPH